MGRWLQDYSGALSAGAAIVLVAVTVLYVRLTASLALEAREQLLEMTKTRLDEKMPVVAIGVDAWHEPNSATVAIQAEIENLGEAPADLTVDFPEDWESGRSQPGTADPGTMHATVNPGGKFICNFTAEVDPNAPIQPKPPLTHLQFLDLEFIVSSQSGGVFDWFTWGTCYDPATDLLQEHSHSGAHERRRYTEIERSQPRNRFRKRLRLNRE